MQPVVTCVRKIIKVRGLAARKDHIGYAVAHTGVIHRETTELIDGVCNTAKGIAAPGLNDAIDGAAGCAAQFVIKIGHRVISPRPVHGG